MLRRKPKDYTLSKYQRNELFRVIESSGLPVTDFELTTRTDLLTMPVTIIRHPISGSIFGIAPWSFKFSTRNRVKATKAEEKLFNAFWYFFASTCKWEEVPGKLAKWVNKVKEVSRKIQEYEQTPDLWGELNRSREFFTEQYEHNVENTPFTSDEQADISARIKQIRDYIEATHELTSDQISHVETKLDQAEQASRRLGRKDWVNVFNGAVFSLILADLITPQTAQHVIMLAVQGLSHLFGIGAPPPHLPPAG